MSEKGMKPGSAPSVASSPPAFTSVTVVSNTSPSCERAQGYQPLGTGFDGPGRGSKRGSLQRLCDAHRRGVLVEEGRV